MKKLEDIPKKDPFVVPDGYFDRLPGVIQSKIVQRPVSQSRVYFRFTLRYIMPVVLLVVVGVWFRILSDKPVEFETELASIDESQLVLYLEDGELNADELLEPVTWDVQELNELESSVYNSYDLNDNDLNDLIDTYSVEPENTLHP